MRRYQKLWFYRKFKNFHFFSKLRSNFVFILLQHIDNEEEAKKAFTNLNNYMLDGRAIHLEYSTSKLRKAPGMDEVCFRCGDSGHK